LKHSETIAEASDQDIRDIAFGLPVLSLRPEDLPCFKPSAFDEYLSTDIAVRIKALSSRLSQFNPQWIVKDTDLRYAATTRSACIQGYRIFDDPQCFLIVRRSKVISATQHLSNLTGLYASELRPSPRLENILPAMDAWHEMHHIKKYIETKNSEPGFHDELEAEQYALARLTSAHSDPKAVRDYILQRALSGFLKDTAKYWVAPSLSAAFNGAAKPDPMKTWESYAELRLRTAAVVIGRDLTHISSQSAKTALRLWDAGNANQIQDKTLCEMVQCFDRIREGHSLAQSAPNKQKMLLALPGVLKSPMVDAFTKAAGKQIVEAVNTFCPNLSAAYKAEKPWFIRWLPG
jgi:hypothetical protein